MSDTDGSEGAPVDPDPDDFYDCDAGDFLGAHGGPFTFDGEEFFDPGSYGGGSGGGAGYGIDESIGPEGFPPKLSSYSEVDIGHPNITFNIGMMTAWVQAQSEVQYVRKKLGMKDEGIETLFGLLFGEESELYTKFKKVCNSCTYDQFCLFMGTFFLECRFSLTYQRLHDDDEVDTSSYLDPARYKRLWTLIDLYKKNEDYSMRAWEEFEGVFNDVAKELLVPKMREFLIQLTIDDDKHWYNFFVKLKDVPLSENSKLKRERHVKDNATGVTVEQFAYPGSGFPVALHYRRKGETEQHSVIAAVKRLFGISEGKELPNLSGKVEFAADRGYWKPGLLYWIISLGADIFGTIMRQSWFAWTFGGKPPSPDAHPDPDKPEHIPVAGPARLFRKVAKHNLGKRNDKDFILCADAFRNGHSSSLAMTLSTKENMTQPKIDMVISTAKSAKAYLSRAVRNSKMRFAMGFKLLIGSDPLERENEGKKKAERVDDHMDILYGHARPLTEGQGDQSWRLMRGFSCTSSSMDRVITARAPYISPDDERIEDYRFVLRYAGLAKLLSPRARAPRDADDADADEEGDEDELSRDSGLTVEDEEVIALDDDDASSIKSYDDSDEEAFPVYKFKLANTDEPDDEDEPPSNEGPSNEDPEQDEPAEDEPADGDEEMVDADGPEEQQPRRSSRRRTAVYVAEEGGLEDDDGLDDDDEDDDAADAANGDEDAEMGDAADEGLEEELDVTPEEYMDTFFNHLSSDEFEQRRKEEAKEFIPTCDDDFISDCLGMLHGAPKKKAGGEDGRRELFFNWTQSSRAGRVTFFMTKREMKELAERGGFEARVKWGTNRSVGQIREDVTKLLNALEYGDGIDDGDEVCSGETGYLSEFLVSSFLKPLKKGSGEGQSKYSTRGHQAEGPFLKQAFEALNGIDYEAWIDEEGENSHRLKLVQSNMEAIYQPGLVHSANGGFWLRDSSDGVAVILEDEERHSTTDSASDSSSGSGRGVVIDRFRRVVPMESKSRCSPRTYNKARELMQQASNELAAIEEIGTHNIMYAQFRAFQFDEETGQYDPNRLNPLLHKLIPDSHELIQILHHAATYRSFSCFLLIGGNKDLMAIYRVHFPPDLISAYRRICAQFYEQDLKPFYMPGEEVPTPDQRWMNAFNTAKLRWLKMDEGSFKYHLGIWRVLNVSLTAAKMTKQTQYYLPLPVTVRIISWHVALWNAMKGGGDTMTKLLDNCQERLGIRTETTAVCARLLLYFAIIFHRANQWCHAKEDLTFYPSLAHARHANNERASFFDSLKKLSKLFLREARRAELDADGGGLDGAEAKTQSLEELFDVDTGSNPDAEPRKSRRTAAKTTPAPVEMNIAGAVTGDTPGPNATTVHERHQRRCDECIGVYYGKMMPDLEKKLKDNRVRRGCHYCGTETPYYCWGCHRFLCFTAPKNTEKKEPKYFTVNTPILDAEGELCITTETSEEGDKTLEYKSRREVGMWTCYHAAHQEGWKAFMKLNRNKILSSGKRPRRNSVG